MTDVFIVGIGMTPLGRHLDKSVKLLTSKSVVAATAARLALVVAMDKHAGHSRATARAGVVGWPLKTLCGGDA